MRWKTRARDMPPRLAIGAFILNSGLSKRGADVDTAGRLHGFASSTYPVLGKVEAPTFTRWLSTSEIALGAALLAPVVPTAVVGAGLAAFSGGLIGLYLRTPGMRREGSLRPTEQGTPLAKDIWLLGVGVGFVLDAVTSTRDRD
jgi:hypothetical protein